MLREELRRVTDDNYFLKRLEFEEPGEYVITITDNDGTLASGFLHVYDLQVNLEEEAGVTYVFDVTVDGKPLKSAEAVVWLNNSTEKRDFFIYEGVLTVNAKLESGLNTFNVQVLGNTIPVEVRHSGSSLLEFYLTYGLPGLLLVDLVFIFARMSRRPMYLLRFSDIGNEVRKDVRLTPADAMMAFKRVRDEMRLGKSPLTSDEFSVALKRYITNGAEVTSGNVEEILNKMCRDGVLDTHRGYYQPRGEGDVKKNTLLRIAREKLIENGISFKSKKSKLVTKDFEIGFFGDSFKKKALLIVDDESEARKIISSMSDKERGMLDIKRSNDMLAFVPIAKLGGYI